VVAEGRLTVDELRSRAWQRLFRDVYTCACVRVTHDVRATRGIRVRRRLLPPDAVVVRRRVRVTTPVVTALDIARVQPFDEAVVLLDRLVGRGVVHLEEIATAASTASGPGCRQLRLAAQFSVYDDVGFVARVDFAWPEQRVAVEYEGRWHGERQHVATDRR
jgi:hypothetical protein